MAEINKDHLVKVTATATVLKAAAAALAAFPTAKDMLVWGNPPLTIENGIRVAHPDMVGRPVAVYAKNDRYLWSATGDMGHGDLPDVDGLHELLRGADKALPWLVRVGHGGYWTIQLRAAADRVSAYAAG